MKRKYVAMIAAAVGMLSFGNSTAINHSKQIKSIESRLIDLGIHNNPIYVRNGGKNKRRRASGFFAKDKRKKHKNLIHHSRKLKRKHKMKCKI